MPQAWPLALKCRSLFKAMAITPDNRYDTYMISTFTGAGRINAATQPNT